jgi:hypothetical protein
MNSKGFVRILETVIASVIILSSLSFFFSIPAPESGWDATSAEIRARDVLSVSAETGKLQTWVRNNDSDSLRNYMRSMFSPSTDFSTEVIGIPNPVIYLGCNCTDAEIADLRSRLGTASFSYKGRNIEIRAEKIDINYIRPETDIIMFYTYNYYDTALTSKRPQIDSFLENGGTIFLFDDLSDQNINDMVNVKKINLFGLEFDAITPQPSGNFISYDRPEFASYNVASYYTELTPGRQKTDNIDGFINPSRIKKDDLHALIVSNVASLAKTNESLVKGNGRSVWFSKFNSAFPRAGDAFKAAIMWASGERFKMDGEVSRIASTQSRSASIIIYDRETYEVKITTWNIF